MHGLTVALLCVFAGILGSCSPARAAVPYTTSRWTEHDTAVYLVSTINLLRTPSGRLTVTAMKEGLGASQFQVWKDVAVDGLYFIQLLRLDGSRAGTLAYQMGDAKPTSLRSRRPWLGAAPAPAGVARAFRHASPRLLASFSSTVPR